MKPNRTRGALAAVFAAMFLALAPTAARAADSAPFRLDTRSGARVPEAVEAIAYSTEWNHAGSVRVEADGLVLKEATAPASGDVHWNAAEAGAGIHLLTHVSGGETLTAAFAVGRSVATVTLGGLAQVYDGTAKPVAVATAPEGLAVAVTYDGRPEAPTDAGSYAVRAEVDDGVWAGVAAGTLEIAKGRQTIEFPETGPQATTNTVVLNASASSGLDVFYAVEGPAILDGNRLSFTGVGMVRVTASQPGNANWEAAEGVEQVFGVGMAVVELGGLAQVYDGTAKPVAVATDPAGLAVAVTYGGSAEPPSGAGNYAVRAEVEDAAWVGSAEGVLVIAKGRQTIAFAEIGPQKTTNTVVLKATAGSGLDVVYAVEGPVALDGNRLSFTGPGTVRVTASQSGDANWEAAVPVVREFAVWKVPEPVQPGISAAFPLDTRSGIRMAGEVEFLAYSTEWNHGGSVRVAADGIILEEASAPASGEVVWDAAGAGVGLHTLTHTSGGETLTAVFRVGEPTQRVVFDATGGTCTEPTRIVTVGQKYGELPTPKWAGHVFLGWYTEQGKQLTRSSKVTTQPVRTVYARWTDQQTLTFDATGGTCDPATKTYVMGGKYASLPTPTRGNHVFLGWFTQAEGGKQLVRTSKVTEKTERTVYARWTDEQTVTFDATGGTCDPATKVYTMGGKYSTLPTPTRDNHVFLGWFTQAEGGKQLARSSTVTVKTARTLYAQWTNEQTVTFDAHGGTCDPATMVYIMGGKYRPLPTPTWKGHVFEGWYTAAENGRKLGTSSVVTKKTARTIHAYWRDATSGMTITGFSLKKAGLPATRDARAAAGSSVLTFDAQSGRVYELQWAATLDGEWTTLRTWTAEADGEASVEVPADSATAGFYRLATPAAAK